jgi:hypothetical protein
MNGHLELLRWARENGCQWSQNIIASVSMKHPETLAWVRAQPWDECHKHKITTLHGPEGLEDRTNVQL